MVSNGALIGNTDKHHEAALVIENGLALMKARMPHAGNVTDHRPATDAGGLEQIFNRNEILGADDNLDFPEAMQVEIERGR